MDEIQTIRDISQLINSGQIEQALQRSQQAIGNFPDSAPLWHLSAAVLAETGEYNQALKAFEQSLAIHPDQPVARLQLALLYLTLEQAQPAIPHLLALKDRQDYPGLFAIALLAMQQDDLHTARQAIEAGIANNQDNPSLNKDMANLLNRMENSATHEPSQPDEDEDRGHLLDIYQASRGSE